MYRLLSTIIFTSLSIIILQSYSFAANIELNDELTQINIVGPISSGDYEKFLNAVLTGGAQANEINLASPGGDVLEAMKIGRLIRELKYTTRAPEGTALDSYCPYSETSTYCTCESACVLIYLGGVERAGILLGIHRPYVPHDLLNLLSFDQAISSADYLDRMMDDYLTTMGAPTNLLEEMLHTPSDTIKYLDEQYINSNLSGYDI